MSVTAILSAVRVANLSTLRVERIAGAPEHPWLETDPICYPVSRGPFDLFPTFLGGSKGPLCSQGKMSV